MPSGASRALVWTRPVDTAAERSTYQVSQQSLFVSETSISEVDLITRTAVGEATLTIKAEALSLGEDGSASQTDTTFNIELKQGANSTFGSPAACSVTSGCSYAAIQGQEIQSGPVEIRISKTGYQTETKIISLVAGSTNSVSIVLKPTKTVVFKVSELSANEWVELFAAAPDNAVLQDSSSQCGNGNGNPTHTNVTYANLVGAERLMSRVSGSGTSTYMRLKEVPVGNHSFWFVRCSANANNIKLHRIDMYFSVQGSLGQLAGYSERDEYSIAVPFPSSGLTRTIEILGRDTSFATSNVNLTTELNAYLVRSVLETGSSTEYSHYVIARSLASSHGAGPISFSALPAGSYRLVLRDKDLPGSETSLHDVGDYWKTSDGFSAVPAASSEQKFFSQAIAVESNSARKIYLPTTIALGDFALLDVYENQARELGTLYLTAMPHSMTIQLSPGVAGATVTLSGGSLSSPLVGEHLSGGKYQFGDTQNCNAATEGLEACSGTVPPNNNYTLSVSSAGSDPLTQENIACWSEPIDWTDDDNSHWLKWNREGSQSSRLTTSNATGTHLGCTEIAGTNRVTTPIAANIPGSAGVTVSQSTLSVVEGSTGTFTVVLDNAPSGNVKVRVAESSADVTLAGQSGDNADLDLTFTTANWMTAQTVTVTGFDDSTAENAESVTLTLTTVNADTVAEYDSVNPDDVVVTIPAND